MSIAQDYTSRLIYYSQSDIHGACIPSHVFCAFRSRLLSAIYVFALLALFFVLACVVLIGELVSVFPVQVLVYFVGTDHSEQSNVLLYVSITDECK